VARAFQATEDQRLERQPQTWTNRAWQGVERLEAAAEKHEVVLPGGGYRLGRRHRPQLPQGSRRLLAGRL